MFPCRGYHKYSFKFDFNSLIFSNFAVRTEVVFYPMNQEEIEEYLNCGEYMDKAGAYAIQGLCAAYIQGICGDYNNVVGLPVGRLCQELKRRGLFPVA